jgi:exosortase
MSVWLVLRACFRTPSARVRSSWAALVVFAGASLVWLLAYAADVMAVQHMLFPAILMLAVAVVAGWKMALKVLFPLAFLYFAIPFWNYGVPLLQNLTIWVVSFVLDLVKVPVFVEGHRVTIPEGVFEIADGCAGLHYFIVAVTISSLYSYMNFERRTLQVAFVAVAAALAIVTNWIRVGSLILFGHFTDMQHYLITHDHYYYGWVLYALALIPTFMVAKTLLNRDSEPATEREADSPPSLVAAARPDLAIMGAFVALLILSGTVVQLTGGEARSKDVELGGGDHAVYGVGFAPISSARIPANGIDGFQAVETFQSADGA